MPTTRPDLRATPSQQPDSRYQSRQVDRPSSSSSDASSASSQVTTLSRPKNTLYSLNSSASRHPPRTSSISGPNENNSTSNISLPSVTTTRPSGAPLRAQNDPYSRKPSPRGPAAELQRHRPRQHSQGFFEPSLPTASHTDHSAMMTVLTASQIAAQAAMQSTQHVRHRSQTIPDDRQKGRKGSRDSPSPSPYAPSTTTSGGARTYQNGLVGSHVAAATTAANVVFPRSPVSEAADQKHKAEKSKKKLFSKPKHIGISRDRDWKDKPLPSPSKLGFGSSSGLSKIVSASTTNLTEISSNNSSMYNLSNASASTVVPVEKGEKDKDKSHRHHFLSRQKLKLKDDHFNLPLSSASSNSKPLDPNAPQSLYSFTPSSPLSSGFGKSGLDLLHGGRALREKKREEKEKEKAMASSLDINRDAESEWPTGATGPAYAPSTMGSSVTTFNNDGVKEALQGFGLHNMTAEDVWDFLKAKLLVVFDGGDVRIAVEDLNKLVVIHIQRCVQKLMPTVVEDLRDLLYTGFSTLNHSISGVPDEKLIPHLVQIWMSAFGTILPFIQAVFLPLDLELKGQGTVMSAREAREFWGALPTNADSPEAAIGDELDVRTIVLVAFREAVILQRYEGLKAVFSRLSLDTIDATIGALSGTSNSSNSGGRPATAASLDPNYSSFNSQSSTALNIAGSYSSDSVSATRSRATSNTSSNPDQLIFQSFTSPQRQLQSFRFNQTPDTSHVITDTVGRLLQCFSILASVQSGDDAQERIETLMKSLKHNWLGRGRTGRDRRGFVGTKVRSAALPRHDSGDSMSMTTNGSKWNITSSPWGNLNMNSVL
ncbi:HbrB-like-domain-containing protein [Talaromyces proteolyticus]|uniref:HbrB-like-domain-containing protein n=1 Tax=Talaromyces proteolyticus TaxID=1131652 RepID=A0AAD4L3L9_9EURO|nr:HbrB-like-domain-containing protein [Talaromyces proteolyticus]KAH8705966.1 HbrB-like-domain-containing protein [Talaromyces proteolyticus]